MKKGVTDKLANLTGFSDSTLDENYGTAEASVSAYSSSSKNANANNIVQQSIIKRSAMKP